MWCPRTCLEMARPEPKLWSPGSLSLPAATVPTEGKRQEPSNGAGCPRGNPTLGGSGPAGPSAEQPAPPWGRARRKRPVVPRSGRQRAPEARARRAGLGAAPAGGARGAPGPAAAGLPRSAPRPAPLLLRPGAATRPLCSPGTAAQEREGPQRLLAGEGAPRSRPQG